MTATFRRIRKAGRSKDVGRQETKDTRKIEEITGGGTETLRGLKDATPAPRGGKKTLAQGRSQRRTLTYGQGLPV